MSITEQVFGPDICWSGSILKSFWLDGPASAVHAFDLTIIRYEIRGALGTVKAN